MKYFAKINPTVLIVLFYLMFTFTFKGISTINYMVIYGACTIYILFNYKYLLKYMKIVYNGCLKYSVITMLICILAAIMIPYILNTNDFSYIETLTSIIRVLIKFVAILILFEKKHKEESCVKLFSQYMVLATVIYIMTSLFFVFIPGLKEIWNSIIEDPDYYIIVENETYITRYGLMGYSGFQVALKVVFAVVINIYLIFEENFAFHKENISLYIAYLILIVGSLLYGRIAMVETIVLTLILIVCFIINNKKIFKYFLTCFIVIVMFLIALYNINDTTRMWINWSLAPFVNFIETGKIYTGSSDIVLKKMIFIPPAETILHGDGYYTDIEGNGYYKSTDVGFMRPILFYGIFFTIVGYLSILIPIISIFKKGIREKEKKKIVFALCWMIVLIISEIKGETFYRLLPIICIYIFLFEEDDNKKSLKLESNKKNSSQNVKMKLSDSLFVSIIVLCYNPSIDKLFFTLESLLRQKKIKYEIIISDDGSSNEYFDLIREYFKKNNFINYKLIKHNCNKGTVLNAYNAVIKSKGKYIKMISPGDAFANSESLFNWIDCLKKSKKKWSFSNFTSYVRKDGEIKYLNVQKYPQDLYPYIKNNEKDIIYNYLLCEDVACGAAIICERALCKKYLSKIINQIKYCEDLIYRLMIFDNIMPFYVNEKFILYECGAGISQQGKNDIWNKRINQDLKNYLKIVNSSKNITGIQKKVICILNEKYNKKFCFRYYVNIHWIKYQFNKRIRKNIIKY